MNEGRLKVMTVILCCHIVKGFQQVAWRWRRWLIGLILMVTVTLTTASLLLHCAGLHVSVHRLSVLLVLSTTANNDNSNTTIYNIHDNVSGVTVTTLTSAVKDRCCLLCEDKIC